MREVKVPCDCGVWFLPSYLWHHWVDYDANILHDALPNIYIFSASFKISQQSVSYGLKPVGCCFQGRNTKCKINGISLNNNQNPLEGTIIFVLMSEYPIQAKLISWLMMLRLIVSQGHQNNDNGIAVSEQYGGALSGYGKVSVILPQTPLRCGLLWMWYDLCFPWDNLYFFSLHCNDVAMATIASQITSLTVVYSTVYSDADQRKHQSSALLAFVWGIHRTGEFPAQRPSYAENVSIWWHIMSGEYLVPTNIIDVWNIIWKSPLIPMKVLIEIVGQMLIKKGNSLAVGFSSMRQHNSL